jgi:hypothetical protein
VRHKTEFDLVQNYETPLTFAVTPDAIRAYIFDDLVADLGGFGAVDKVWVGVASCSPGHGTGAFATFPTFTLAKGVRAYNPDYGTAGN